jgi:hypothetical protein
VSSKKDKYQGYKATSPAALDLMGEPKFSSKSSTCGEHDQNYRYEKQSRKHYPYGIFAKLIHEEQVAAFTYRGTSTSACSGISSSVCAFKPPYRRSRC